MITSKVCRGRPINVSDSSSKVTLCSAAADVEERVDKGGEGEPGLLEEEIGLGLGIDETGAGDVGGILTAAAGTVKLGLVGLPITRQGSWFLAARLGDKI